MEKILAWGYMIVVFILAIVYLFFSIYQWIDRINGRCFVSKIPKPEKPPEPAFDIVGKTYSVFLAPLVIEPFMSENLETEQKSQAETEPDILTSEVEANLINSDVLDENELDDFSEENSDTEGDLSQGLTFEQIGNAIDVVKGIKSGENDELLAGETFSIMPTDFLDVICMQSDHEAMVKKLITGYLDFPQKMKPIPAMVANFDINKYV